jgi:hypothetical protein
MSIIRRGSARLCHSSTWALRLSIEFLLPAFLIPIAIEGVITGPPDVRATYINLRVNADRLTTPDRSSHPIEGVVLVRPSRPAEFRYGDRVRVTGELNTPLEFPTLGYADYLARQSVHSLIDRPRGARSRNPD